MPAALLTPIIGFHMKTPPEISSGAKAVCAFQARN
ncbi:hypothetical protein PSE_0333 [Pseudovibrio sp. FO-BEG1]|nr:hypothetical protein PSE_0333 [Pseudovibrio sp. FO-BEG1]